MASKEIRRSQRLSGVEYEIRGPLVEEANRMEMQGNQIMRLNIGNPPQYGINPPDEIMHDLIYNLHNSQGYSESKGIFSARKAIMQYYQLKNFTNLSIEDIFVGNGVSEMIIMSMQSLLNDGDEMLVPSPDYPLWTAAVTLSGGNAVHYICDDQADWMPDIADIKAKITPRTRGIVLITPNNPTGAVYSRAVLEEIAEIARQNNLLIFSDEIYERLVMDNYQHVSIGSIAPDLPIATLNGLSKSHRVTGLRAGWIVFSGDKRHIRDYIEGLNLMASMRLCSNVPAQSIIQTSIGGYQSVDELLIPGGRIYEQRNAIYNGLSSIPGVSVMKPKAGLYIFPKIDTQKYAITDDKQFAMDLLHKERLLVVPGSGFNWQKQCYFRIVYLASVKELDEAASRLQHFLHGCERSSTVAASLETK